MAAGDWVGGRHYRHVRCIYERSHLIGEKLLGTGKSTRKFLLKLGFDWRTISNYKFLPRYFRDKKQWMKSGGKIDKTFMVLSDFRDSAGVAKGHYFHQDLLVANYIFLKNPERHIDVGSRIDGFVAHVASFREIEVLDVRPLPATAHTNIVFTQADLMNDCGERITDSLSCLHAIEHFGLGRYGDPIDVLGHEKGIENLAKMLKKDGFLYLSFPIGNTDQVHFNAHRVLHPKTILRYESVKNMLELKQFDYVDDKGNLHRGADLETTGEKVRYGCGIYTFKKR